MRLGYGVRVKESKGREYVDVWRYEDRDGRRVQVFEYVGALRDPATEGRVKALTDRFQARAMEEFRRRARKVAAVAAPL
ncbi:MAG: hypothetical protein A3K65_03910 [Euryarchaeota archaeon RBG_16_68_12]|nr:MAG: hypothetical protein A3K65_03910 [Euryarchaeota archaeon RBG_16_68_12]